MEEVVVEEVVVEEVAVAVVVAAPRMIVVQSLWHQQEIWLHRYIVGCINYVNISTTHHFMLR